MANGGKQRLCVILSFGFLKAKEKDGGAFYILLFLKSSHFKISNFFSETF